MNTPESALTEALRALADQAPTTLALEGVRREGRRRHRRHRRRLGVASAGVTAVLVALLLVVVGVSSRGHTATLIADTPTASPAATGAPVALQDPTALVGSWRVAAAGEPASTVLDLGDGAFVYRACGEISASWTADPAGLFAAYSDGYSMGCSDSVPWLTAAFGYRVEKDGSRTLLARDGSTLATLLPGGNPAKNPDYLRTPPVLTSELAAGLAAGKPLPADATAAELSDIVGKWGPTDGDPAAGSHQPYVDFAADGTMTGSDGCNHTDGSWRLASEGALVSTVGLNGVVGCAGIRELVPDSTVRHAAIVGGELDFYDTAGKVVERLVRAAVTPTTLPVSKPPVMPSLPQSAAVDGGGCKGIVVTRDMSARANSNQELIYTVADGGPNACQLSPMPTGLDFQVDDGAHLSLRTNQGYPIDSPIAALAPGGQLDFELNAPTDYSTTAAVTTGATIELAPGLAVSLPGDFPIPITCFDAATDFGTASFLRVAGGPLYGIDLGARASHTYATSHP